MSAGRFHIPLGTIAVRLTPFGAPHQELGAVARPPWPRWLTGLHTPESGASAAIAPEEGRVTLSAALSAVRDRVGHRLTLLAWIVAELEQLGWDVRVVGDDVIASMRMAPEHARETLEAAGVAGAMTAVSELDANGWPRIYEAWELSR